MSDFKVAKEKAIEAALNAVAPYEEMIQIVALTEAASLVAVCCLLAIPVDVPMTEAEAVRRFMVRSGCNEQKARDLVRCASDFDEPPRPALSLVKE